MKGKTRNQSFLKKISQKDTSNFGKSFTPVKYLMQTDFFMAEGFRVIHENPCPMGVLLNCLSNGMCPV
jgi:hypothetical protein